ncbi:MAG: FAD-dependent oxidoreductase [Pseudomonadota bacterium]
MLDAGTSAATWSKSLWSATVGEPEVPSDPPADADVIVVGGGFTGLSAALRLAESGLSVTVLEAERVGFGASGRNGGQVIPGLKLDPDDMVARWGEDRGEAAAAFAGGTADVVFELIERHGIACNARRDGWIQAAHSEVSRRAGLERAEQWARRGAPVETLSAEELGSLSGTSAYQGGWRDLRAGALQPLAYARGLARAARDAGVRIAQETRVTALRPDADGWRVETAGGVFRAGRVIAATNAYSDDLVPGLRRSVLQFQSIIVATKPLSPNVAASVLPSGAVLSETRKLAFYMRRDADGRLIFGGRGTSGASHSVRLQNALEAAMRRMFPQVGDAPVEHAWSGHVAITLDGLPRVHQPAPGLWCALGYNGRGVAMSTALGRALADHLATGAPLPLPETALKPLPWHALRRPAIGVGTAYHWVRDALGLPGR